MKRVVTSIWFLAFVIVIPVIVYLPPILNKYTIEYEGNIHSQLVNLKLHFVDLNSDGIKEQVRKYKDSTGRFSIQYFSEGNLAPIDQLNFSSNFNITVNFVFFEDVDKDSYTEIYGFTLKEDSLFLNWFEPYPDKSGLEMVRFITTIKTYQGNNVDVRIHECHFIDLNKDGYKDIIFPVVTGYSLSPRSVFIYDWKNDTVYHSEDDGINDHKLTFEDLDGDNQPEIIVDNAAAGNLKDEDGNYHTDNYSWLVVYNSNLEEFFKPVRFTEGLNNLLYNFVVGENEKSILSFNFNENISDPGYAYLINVHGEKTDSLKLPNRLNNQKYKVKRVGENRFWLMEGNHITEISDQLEILNHHILPLDESVSINIAGNFNGEGIQIYATDFSRENIFIFPDGFKNPLQIRLENPVQDLAQNNILENGRFYIIDQKFTEHYYRLTKNGMHFLKYPVYALIYLAIVGFIWLLQMARMRQLKEKIDLQNKVRELQLQSLNNQLDPHFIFNTFNTIASVVKQGRSEEAYDAMVRFSKMVRLNLENSGDINTTLKKELDFVQDYLFIQKFRFKDMFEYTMNIDKQVNMNVSVPKLLLQIHVENALKHGIRPSQKPGKLKIKVKSGNGLILIEIEDNGIGRKESAKINAGGAGIGLKTIQQILELNNQNRKNKIRQRIIDLKSENGEALGTKVLLEILVKKFY